MRTFLSFRSASSASLALVSLLALPASAVAAPFVVNGNATPFAASATGTVTLSGTLLTLSLTNTSPFDARVTGLGFDLLDGDFSGNNSSGLNGFSGNNTGGFTFRDGKLGNVPQLNAVVLDFGWTTGNSGNFTGGSPNNGIAPLATHIFTVNGVFGGLSEDELASALFVRFQRVGEDGNGSDVGRGRLEQVPEPASFFLLGAGVLAFARRRARSLQ